MSGIDIFDDHVEIAMMENALLCDLYTESTGTVQKIIDRIKQIIDMIKRKITKVIQVNGFETKKLKIVEKLKDNKLVRFKTVESHDVKKTYLLFVKVFSDILKDDDPEVCFDAFSDTLDEITSVKKEYKLGELVREISISKYVDLIDKIDDETDKQNSIYNKLMKNEEENEDEIDLVIERLKQLSKLTSTLNREITRELQIVSMILKYD